MKAIRTLDTLLAPDKERGGRGEEVGSESQTYRDRSSARKIEYASLSVTKLSSTRPILCSSPNIDSAQ